jgi:diguanylate cyclase (GGDEF)-like protein
MSATQGGAMPRPRPRALQFRVATLLLASGLIAAVMITTVLVPQLLARDARLQVLRDHVDQVARLAASHLDGDVHRQLLDGTASEAMRLKALAPLLRLHQNWPEAIYVYTMGVRDGKTYFVLDTAQDPAFAKARGLRMSKYMEPFTRRTDYSGDWLRELSGGHTWINPGFERDDYGYFLSGHAPIFDSAGGFVGFVGVDFDLRFYLGEEARFRTIENASIASVLLLSVLLGYVWARYHYNEQAVLHRQYQISMQDALTGLPNRRGALAAIDAIWRQRHDHTHAALLVDVDNFKSINDTYGHVVGDEVLKTLAQALHDSVRPGDIAARLGGDEFLVFARDCDRHGAETIAARLLAAVREASVEVGFRVSVGISVARSLDGGFDLLYRQADKALYQAKGEGRNRYEVFAAAAQA